MSSTKVANKIAKAVVAQTAKRRVRTLRRARRRRRNGRLLKTLVSRTKKAEGKLAKDLALINEPFSGHNQNAVNWLRRYLNPCDDVSLTMTGIPDMETAPAYTWNMPLNLKWDKSMFENFTTYTQFTSGGNVNMTKLSVQRLSWTATRFYLFPNAFAPLLVIEEGMYNVVARNQDDTQLWSRQMSYMAKWIKQDAAEIIDMDLDDLQKPISTTTLSKQQVQFYRNDAFGITINNAQNLLSKAGTIYARYFQLQTRDGSHRIGSTTFVENTIQYYGLPFTESDFSAQGAYSDNADKGLYGVLYNWHPDFKYQQLNDRVLTNWNSIDREQYSTPIIQGIDISNQSLLRGVQSNDMPRTGVSLSLSASLGCQLTSSDAVFPSGLLVLDSKTIMPVNKAYATELPFFYNDSWSWKGLAIYFSAADIGGLDASVKVAGAYSAILAPSANNRANVVKPPPYDPEILKFAALFTLYQDGIYPASYNSWNQIWKRIKQFYKNNKSWINPLIIQGGKGLLGALGL